jgi:nucleotide-binding universal stress UspA family protein
MPSPQSAATTDDLSILACLALSPRARAVAGEAAHIANKLGARLTFVHAGHDTPEVRKKLEDAISGLQLTKAATLRVVQGKPDKVVQDLATQLNPTLVVAGALEKEGFIEGFFGSIARRIVRRVPTSVVLLTEPEAQGNPLQRIVICTRLDDASHRMTGFALNLARRAGARQITVVHESDYFARLALRYGDATMDQRDDQRRLWKNDVLHQMSSSLEAYDLSGFELSLEVLEGSEGLESVELAKAVGADLLVYPAPSRPLSFWDRFFHHPTEVVMDRLPCAVLIHRDTA